jgi:hypothetical protein
MSVVAPDDDVEHGSSDESSPFQQQAGATDKGAVEVADFGSSDLLAGVRAGNWDAHRLSLSEVSGALGDLGTFLPLVIYISSGGALDFGTVMIFHGLYNLLTTLWFEFPIAVQPMHGIVSIAVAQSLDAGQIAAAGVAVALALLALGLSDLIHTVREVTPEPIVRGIQLGLGLKLIGKGLSDKAHGAAVQAVDGSGYVWLGLDSIALSAVIAAFLLIARRSKKLQGMACLLVVFWGACVAMFLHPELVQQLTFGPSPLHGVRLPSAHQWRTGVFSAALPQLPLTVFNAVIATSALATELFPRCRTAGVKRIALSVGALNCVLPLCGAVPSCHGAGGLAAQVQGYSYSSGYSSE